MPVGILAAGFFSHLDILYEPKEKFPRLANRESKIATARLFQTIKIFLQNLPIF